MKVLLFKMYCIIVYISNVNRQNVSKSYSFSSSNSFNFDAGTHVKCNILSMVTVEEKIKTKATYDSTYIHTHTHK